MRPYLPALLAILLIPALLAACGGDDDDDGGDNSPNGDTTSAAGGDETPGGDGTPAESPTPTPETPLPTPTRVADDEPVMIVSGPGGVLLEPTAADLAAMEQITVTADGKEYTGVSLVDLAARVGATPESTVDLKGIRSDGRRYAIIRFESLAEIGDDSVVYIAESGNVNVASGTIAPANWLSAISEINFY